MQAETDALLDRRKQIQHEWNPFFVKRNTWLESTSSMDLVHCTRISRASASGQRLLIVIRLCCAGHAGRFFLNGERKKAGDLFRSAHFLEWIFYVGSTGVASVARCLLRYQRDRHQKPVVAIAPKSRVLLP